MQYAKSDCNQRLGDYRSTMTEGFRDIAKSAMTLEPEERLALATALDLSLDDNVRSNALRAAVQEGSQAIENGEFVLADSAADVDEILNNCLADAKRQVRDSAQ